MTWQNCKSQLSELLGPTMYGRHVQDLQGDVISLLCSCQENKWRLWELGSDYDRLSKWPDHFREFGVNYNLRPFPRTVTVNRTLPPSSFLTRTRGRPWGESNGRIHEPLGVISQPHPPSSLFFLQVYARQPYDEVEALLIQVVRRVYQWSQRRASRISLTASNSAAACRQHSEVYFEGTSVGMTWLPPTLVCPCRHGHWSAGILFSSKHWGRARASET